MRNTIRAAAACLIALSLASLAHAQDRARTWDFDAGLQWSGSLTLDGQMGTGLDIDDDLGFKIGGTYNFTNRWALGFGISWVSPRYTATYLPEAGPPLETVRATMDVFSLYAKGTFNLLEGPITPYAELGVGWTEVDSNIADGPPITGCWWDPWWGYICAPFYSTYGENLTSWSGAVGVRWDVNRLRGVKASYGVTNLDTSSNTENATLDMFAIEAIFRY